MSAIRARAVDVGQLGKVPPAAVGAPAAKARRAAATSASSPTEAAASMGSASFVTATATRCGDETAELVRQLHAACEEAFDALEFVEAGGVESMQAVLDGATLLTASTDGSVVLSFESLASLDTTWTVRDELCQGLERLLGSDLGDVRKISQVNLSVGEHLMDVTLMEALCELLTDTVTALRAGSGRRAASAA